MSLVDCSARRLLNLEADTREDQEHLQQHHQLRPAEGQRAAGGGGAGDHADDDAADHLGQREVGRLQGQGG